MANTLGSVTLPADIIWTAETEIGMSGLYSEVRMSLNRTPNIWEKSQSGRHIDLVGGSNWGCITRIDLLALQALVIAGAVHTLAYNAVNYSVRFRNEDGAIEADPWVRNYSGVKADTDWYCNVVIRLMEI